MESFGNESKPVFPQRHTAQPYSCSFQHQPCFGKLIAHATHRYRQAGSQQVLKVRAQSAPDSQKRSAFALGLRTALGIMNSEASNVLKVYLGAGETGGYLPFDHEKRMSAAYNHDVEAKLSEIKKYLEVDHPQSQWAYSDLAQEQKAFEAQLAQRFPELDKVAINSLVCRWSYSWR